MPRPARQPKRPYVRPRIGHSIYRSVGYGAAFLVLLLVALFVPRPTAPPPSVEGDWLFETAVPVGDLPAGQSVLLLHGGHYTLRTETPGGVLRVEFGSMTENGERVALEPVEVIIVDSKGGGSLDTSERHAFWLRYENGNLSLETADGPAVVGKRQPFVPAATGTVAEPR